MAEMNCHFDVIENFCDFFYFTTLTYVLMDNFCPCYVQKVMFAFL